MKLCQHPGCNNPVFGLGYCRFHQYLRSDYRPLQRRSLSGKGKMPPEGESRLNQRKQYKKLCDELDAENSPCFFCGKPIKGKADHHHIFGRAGNLYLDKRYIVRAHRGCHNKHKFLTVEQLQGEWWWEIYLERIRTAFPKAYEMEMNRIDKA